MINRGYFARVQAIRQAVAAFQRGTGPARAQILSLGAGFDTTFFRLSAAGARPARFVEVDHKEVTCSKCRLVQKNAVLADLLGAATTIDVDAGTILSDNYALVPADLRNLESVKGALSRAGLDSGAPTLVLMECVMAYLDAEATRRLLRHLTESFDSCGVLIYDMIGPDDPFGKQLILNVESRGCPLPGIRSFPTAASHAALLRESGFAVGGIHDMLAIYNQYVDQAERKRTEKLEFLDELEEWHLIMSHYCLSYGFKGSPELFQSPDMPCLPGS